MQSTQFMVVMPNISLIYVEGNFINIQFEAINGKKPYIWTFTNLPPGLLSHTNGQVNGTFLINGYYTFAASVSDSSGNTVDSFTTFNIQPKTASRGTISLTQTN